jgi:hypothetical protein
MPPVDMPAAAPFRAAPFEGMPVTQPSKRWVGLPIIGIALLSLRFLLLCARTSTPSYSSYDPVYLPPTIDTSDWSKDFPALKNPLQDVRVGPVAVDDRGTTWFEKSGAVWTQDKGGVAHLAAAGQAGLVSIGVHKRVPHWLTSVGIYKLVGEDVVTVHEGSYDAMLIDGDDAFLVGSDGVNVKRVSLVTKDAKPVTVAKVKETATDVSAYGPLAADDTWLYFVLGKGVARVAKKGVEQAVSTPWVETSVTAMAADKGTLYVTNEDGVAQVRGGKTTTLAGESVNKTSAILYGDVVVAVDGVYFADLSAASEWHVNRVKAGGSPEMVATTLVEPHLTARAGVVYWSTTSGVSTSAQSAQ